MTDMLEPLIIAVVPARSYLLVGRMLRATLLERVLLRTLLVKCLLVGREHKSSLLWTGFRFVWRAKSEGKISIRIRQLRGGSSGTARARELWQLAEIEQDRGRSTGAVVLVYMYACVASGLDCSRMRCESMQRRLDAVYSRKNTTLSNVDQDLRCIRLRVR